MNTVRAYGQRFSMAIAIALLVSPNLVSAQPDNFSLVVDSSTATAGASLAAMGYDPVSDTMYVAGFGAGGELRRVQNVSGSQSATQMVSATAWQLFLLDGQPTWSGGQFIPGGLLLNPLPIYDQDGATVLFPAWSQAWIIDGTSSVIEQPAGIRHDELTRRVYRYNLQQVQSPPDPKPAPPPYYDGRDVFTSLVTRAALKTAIGLPVNSTAADNVSRQFAWSSDGQSIYFVDFSTTFGGVWKVNARTGDAVRIFENTSASRIITEPGVVHTSVRDLNLTVPEVGDQVLFRGTAASGNAGGIDYIIDTGSSVTGPYALLTEADLEKVLEWNGREFARRQNPDGTDPGVNPDAQPDVRSITVDSDGTIYLFEGTSDSVLRLDGSGRLAAIATRPQHLRWLASIASNSTNTGTLRLQLRPAHYGPLPVRQLMFQSVGPRAIGGIYAFATGDFNRDGTADSADLPGFMNALCRPIRTYTYTSGSNTYYHEAPADSEGNELRTAQPAEYTRYLKYDLNGNGLVTARDRRILLVHMGVAAVDFDRDGDVDHDDFGHFQECFTGAGNRQERCDCVDARLDDDTDVDAEDFSILAHCRSGPAVPADPACSL